MMRSAITDRLKDLLQAELKVLVKEIGHARGEHREQLRERSVEVAQLIDRLSAGWHGPPEETVKPSGKPESNHDE